MAILESIILYFFTTIGIGVCTYSLFYIVVLCFLDCDLELAFYSKFFKSPSSMKGMVVFITGASSGIGEHTAIALAKHGVKLVLTARRLDELNRVKNKCLDVCQKNLKSDDILIIPFDLLKYNEHESAWKKAVYHFGSIDVLFNNAGRSQRAMWDKIQLSVDREIFDLNVFAPVNLTRIALEHFQERGRGHVAVVSSLAGIIKVPFSGSYTGSKHAIQGYFGGLSFEKVNKNIDVTILCPGPVFTNFLQESFTDKKGEKYGIFVQSNDRRLTGERCGELCAIALANKTRESWMGVFPTIPLTYIAVYFPTLLYCAIRIFGSERIFKIRDSKELNLEQGKRNE